MKIPFTKMQGAGNDFVMLDAVTNPALSNLSAAQFRALADRHFGIGCDQILMVEKPRSADADFSYRIFNHDGGEVEHCGNGARCFVVFARDRGLTTKHSLRVQTMNNLIVPELQDDGQVTVNMGAPMFEEAKLPFNTTGLTSTPQHKARKWRIDVGGAPLEIVAVSMGNPHAVQIVSNVDTAPVLTLGPLIERHARFAKGVNAGFMQIVDMHHIRLRVYERGAGETLACGTGLCAAVAAGIQQGVLQSPVRVDMKGGSLSVAWAGGDNPLMMTGPATKVFEGTFEFHDEARDDLSDELMDA
jgi:diaminopimelate epimerase